MDEQRDEQDEDSQPLVQITKEQVALASGTMLVASGVDLLAHLGPTGLVIGGILAFAAARHGQGVYRQMKGIFSSPHRPVSRRGRRFVDMALGRFPTDTSAEEEATQVPRSKVWAGEDGNPFRATISQETEPSIPLPHAPAFEQMCHLITSERLVLCYTAQGPAYGSIEDLLSMAVVGKPGRGKTTALCYYVAILLSAGAEVHVWDPHGSMNDLAGVCPRLHYTDVLEDILASVALLRQELDERSRLYKQRRQTRHPLLLLVDELPVIGDYEKHLKKRGVAEEETPTFLITRFVLEARKWRCFFIGSGQSTDAEILPTRVTENLSSRIVFYASDRRARMAGLEQEVVKTLLPLLKHAPPGVMIFDCSRWDEPVLGAIPNITISDVQQFLASLPRQGEQQQSWLSAQAGQTRWLPAMEALQPRRTPPPQSEMPMGRSTATLSPELKRALETWQNGHQSVDKLKDALGITHHKAYSLYRELKARHLIA